eukprot:6242706-Pyramimonas_sp.AAC.1
MLLIVSLLCGSMSNFSDSQDTRVPKGKEGFLSAPLASLIPHLLQGDFVSGPGRKGDAPSG